jgi:hypothetical protein
MRLLDTTNIQLHEFGEDIPFYAILSHRWDNSEVSFQDCKDGQCTNMPGYPKILNCCKQAAKDGWKYVVRQISIEMGALVHADLFNLRFIYFCAIRIKAKTELVDRLLLYRQNQQLRALGIHKFHVSLVS